MGCSYVKALFSTAILMVMVMVVGMAPAAKGYACGGVAPKYDTYPSSAETVLSILVTSTPTSQAMMYRAWYPTYRRGNPTGTALCYQYNAEACATCLEKAKSMLVKYCTSTNTTGAYYGSNCNMEYWPIAD